MEIEIYIYRERELENGREIGGEGERERVKYKDASMHYMNLLIIIAAGLPMST